MKICVDSEYHCHTTNLEGTREIEDPFFDGKCTTFVEGYCYDDSKSYIQNYQWKPYFELDAAQREYERQSLTEYNEAFSCLIG